MDKCFITQGFTNIPKSNIEGIISDFLDTARYLDKIEIKIDIDGQGKGVGTKDSFTYHVKIRHLEDCVTY